MNFINDSNATKFFKDIRRKKDLQFILLTEVTIPTHLLKDVYFRSPVEDLLAGKHEKTGEVDTKMTDLKKSIMDVGWKADFNSIADNIALEWEEGRFKITNGQHRLVLIEVLGIPHFKANIAINYDINDQYETLAAFNLKNEITNYQPKTFNENFTKEELNKTEDLLKMYSINKTKHKWYRAFT